MTQLISLLQAGIMFGTVIMFGAIGEILTEKSGNLNLGVPGIMYLGGISGLIGVFFYERSTPDPNGLVCILIALICAFAAAVIGGLIYSFLTISLRANQNVTGLTLTIFAAGFANFFGGSLNKLAGGVGQVSVAATSAAFRANLPFAQNLPPVFSMLLGYGFMVYLAVVLAIVLNWFIMRTSTGLNLRAVGENPATADAAGINVTKYKYLGHLPWRRYLRPRRPLLCDGLYQGHLGQRRRHRNSGLAGCRACHLLQLEEYARNLGGLSVRHPLLALFLHSGPHPEFHGAV